MEITFAFSLVIYLVIQTNAQLPKPTTRAPSNYSINTPSDSNLTNNGTSVSNSTLNNPLHENGTDIRDPRDPYTDVDGYEKDPIGPLNLIITPNVTKIEITQDHFPNVTCTATGRNLHKYPPYVLAWYKEDDEVNSEINATSIQLKGTFTVNDTYKGIYCAMRLNILTPKIYTFVASEKINVTVSGVPKSAKKPLENNSWQMTNHFVYTAINLILLCIFVS